MHSSYCILSTIYLFYEFTLRLFHDKPRLVIVSARYVCNTTKLYLCMRWGAINNHVFVSILFLEFFNPFLSLKTLLLYKVYRLKWPFTSPFPALLYVNVLCAWSLVNYRLNISTYLEGHENVGGNIMANALANGFKY